MKKHENYQKRCEVEMQRVNISLASIIYVLVLVIISIEFIAVFSPIHQNFINDNDLKSTDKTISKFFVKQNPQILENIGLDEKEQNILQILAKNLNKGLFFLAGLIAILGFLIYNLNNKEKHIVLMSPFIAIIILAIPSIIMLINFQYINEILHKLFLHNIYLNNSILSLIYNKSFILSMAVISLEIVIILATIKIFSYKLIRKTINHFHNHYFSYLDEHNNREEKHKEEFIIRKARPEEAKTIKELIKKSIIDLDSKKQIGLLEYEPPTTTQIKIGIKENQPIYVITKKDKIIGTVLSFDKEFLGNYFPEDKIEQFLFKRFINFHHIDTIVIKDYYRKRGLGTKLLNRLIADLSHHPRNHLLFTAILHKPRIIDIQTHFLRKFLFQHKGDLFIDDETAFGIYMKQLEFNKLDVGLDWIKTILKIKK